MKKILIISPHFPPSGLAAVHRSRLFAQHLPSFGWEPVILTVHEKHYEEQYDWDLVKLLPENLRIEKVNAFPVTKPRLIGDIGLRGFIQLTLKVLSLIKQEKFSFLYIPIPSFYVSMIGRIAHARTGISYGIDYIDPWVHNFPGSDKTFSRHWWSTKIAAFFEPIAVRKASLITGVADGYFKGVQHRNAGLAKKALFCAMPYGGEKIDNEKVKELGLKPYLFKKRYGKIQLVYAGAMLPKAFPVLEALLLAIKKDREIFGNLEIHFIGTGKTPNDPEGFNIRPLAETYGLWEEIVYEYPARIPYLDVLAHLELAEGVFIMGSIESHYTPSKVYQSVLSKKPIWAVLHRESSACNIIRSSRAGVVLDFTGEFNFENSYKLFGESFTKYSKFSRSFNYSNVNQEVFESYSAQEVTRLLANQLDALKEHNK